MTVAALVIGGCAAKRTTAVQLVNDGRSPLGFAARHANRWLAVTGYIYSAGFQTGRKTSLETSSHTTATHGVAVSWSKSELKTRYVNYPLIRMGREGAILCFFPPRRVRAAATYEARVGQYRRIVCRFRRFEDIGGRRFAVLSDCKSALR